MLGDGVHHVFDGPIAEEERGAHRPAEPPLDHTLDRHELERVETETGQRPGQLRTLRLTADLLDDRGHDDVAHGRPVTFRDHIPAGRRSVAGRIHGRRRLEAGAGR